MFVLVKHASDRGLASPFDGITSHQRDAKGPRSDEGAEGRANLDPTAVRTPNMRLPSQQKCRTAQVRRPQSQYPAAKGSMCVGRAKSRSLAERLQRNAAGRRFSVPGPRHGCHQTNKHTQPHVETHCGKHCWALLHKTCNAEIRWQQRGLP